MPMWSMNPIGGKGFTSRPVCEREPGKCAARRYSPSSSPSMPVNKGLHSSSSARLIRGRSFPGGVHRRASAARSASAERSSPSLSLAAPCIDQRRIISVVTKPPSPLRTLWHASGKFKPSREAAAAGRSGLANRFTGWTDAACSVSRRAPRGLSDPPLLLEGAGARARLTRSPKEIGREAAAARPLLEPIWQDSDQSSSSLSFFSPFSFSSSFLLGSWAMTFVAVRAGVAAFARSALHTRAWIRTRKPDLSWLSCFMP
jgi:hypothetical protein